MAGPKASISARSESRVDLLAWAKRETELQDRARAKFAAILCIPADSLELEAIDWMMDHQCSDNEVREAWTYKPWLTVGRLPTFDGNEAC